MSQNNQLDRRSFLKSTAIVTSTTAGSLAAPAIHAQGPVVIKLQTSWPDSDIWMDFAREYTKRVEEMSGRRITFDLQPAGTIVEAFQVMDAVSDGILDAAHTVPIYWYDKHKAASLFGTGPFWGGSATTMLSWFYQGGGIDLYNELTQNILDLNVYGFLGFPMFAQPFGWFKNEISTITELDGFKYRAVGLTADFMRLMGMSVAHLSGEAIDSAMKRGEIDGFEYNNPSTDRRLGAQNIAKNYYLSSFHQASETFEFLFNKDFYDDLETDLQAILKFAVEAASTSNTALAMRTYSDDLEKLESEHQVKVHRTSKNILEGQLRAWDELIEELNEDEFSNRIIKSQQKWVEKVTYYELMNAPDSKLAYNHYFPDKLKL